jgi:predicted dehydrogenase
MVGHLHVSWLDPHKSRKITVVGADKMVVFDDMEADRKVTVYDKGATTTRTQFETYGEYIARSGDVMSPRISNEEPLRIECQHFVDCVRDGARPLSDGRDALNVVRVLEAMEISLREGGRPVKTAELA